MEELVEEDGDPRVAKLAAQIMRGIAAAPNN